MKSKDRFDSGTCHFKEAKPALAQFGEALMDRGFSKRRPQYLVDALFDVKSVRGVLSGAEGDKNIKIYRTNVPLRQHIS